MASVFWSPAGPGPSLFLIQPLLTRRCALFQEPQPSDEFRGQFCQFSGESGREENGSFMEDFCLMCLLLQMEVLLDYPAALNKDFQTVTGSRLRKLFVSSWVTPSEVI